MYSFSSPLLNFHSINLVTADGIKGKTWGPSTLHQRERGYLPALNQTTVTSTPQFSKSAPNLDKSRANLGLPSAAATATATTVADVNDAAAAAAAIADLHQPLQSTSSSSHNNILGKSVEGLNQIQIVTSGNSSSSNSTIKTHRYNIGSLDALHCDGERYTYDDDDDDVEVKGCFGFIRSDDGYVKRKKHSLDSKMAEHSHQSANLISLRTPTITAAPAATATLMSKKSRESSNRKPELCVDENRNCDEPPYDRVFYRNIQKSLEEIFARDDFNQRFASQKSRNSKSSGDLTMYNEEDDVYGQYQFQRSNSKSEFHRECFFVRNADDSSEESDPHASIKSNTSSNPRSQEYGRKVSTNNDRLLDTNDALIDSSNTSSFSSKYYRTQDDRTNSICSDDHSSTDMSITPSASRKNSVTFRVDGGSNGNANTSSTVPISPNQLIYANLETASFDSPNRKILTKPRTNNYPRTRYALIDHQKNQLPLTNLHRPTNGLVTTSGVSVLKSALSKKEKKDKPSSSIISAKSKCIGLAKFLKFPRKATVLHSNSFYSKGEDKTEMNEQLLLDDDKTAHSTSSSTNDPIYDSVFRTNNFLLAKSSDTWNEAHLMQNDLNDMRN